MKKSILLLSSILSLLFISCSDFINSAVEKNSFSDESYCTVRGSLFSEIDYLTSSRSAFPANDVDLSLYTTKIYYKKTGDTEGTLCCTTTGSTFELKLPSLGTYYLEAESYNTPGVSNIIDFKTIQPVEITLTEDAPYKNDVSLFLKVVIGESDATGSIELYMKSFNPFIVRYFEITENGNSIHNGELYDYASVYRPSGGVTAGVHNYVFSFYDATFSNLVYQCTETVTVFPNKKTDTWVNNGNAEYFSTENISGKDVLVMNITQECLDNFALTNFYVDSSGDDSGNGSYFAPVKTLKAAVDKCTDSSKNYTINIMGEVEANADDEILLLSNITFQKAQGVTSAKIKHTSTSNRLFNISSSSATVKISGIDIEGPDTACSSSGAAIFNHGQLYLTNVNLSKFKSSSNGGCLVNDANGNIFITGGSIKGCEGSNGGAIYNEGKDIKIKDCTINKCKADFGGAIYNSFDNVRITLEGNTVIGEDTGVNATNANYGNHASSSGGAVYMSRGNLYLTENTVIAKNYSAGNGGGLYLGSYGAKVYLQDSASIKNCTAATNGSGIYVSAAACRVYMKDSAYLDPASDVWLNGNAKVTLNGDLTPPPAANGIAATLTPQFYDPSADESLYNPIKLLEESTAGLIAVNYSKFAVTSKDANPAIEWYVTVNGKLNSKAPGDVLFATLNGVAPTDTSKVYVIDIKEELETLAGWVKASNLLEGIHFKLNTDITLDSSWNTDHYIGYSSSKPFKGKFDGNNKTITYDSSEYALFAYTENAEISNVITKGTFKPSSTTPNGAVVNILKGGKISNCVNYATITANSKDVGGIVGRAQSVGGDLTCIIENCSNYGNITTDMNINHMGGIVGTAYSVTVRNCYNAGNISGTDSIGGIAGQTNAISGVHNRTSLYENCGNIGTISATRADTATRSGAGGIVGGCPSSDELYKPEFINCWSLGTIKADKSDYRGALLGTPYFKKFTNCYYNGSAISNIAAQTQTVSGVTSTSDNDNLVNKLNTWAISNGKTEYKTWIVKDGKVVFSDM